MRIWLLALGVIFTLPPAPVRATSLRPPAQPEIAIIIDDLGTNLDVGQRVLRLPVAVAASILPLTPYSRSLALQAGQQNRAVLLHAPMEAKAHNRLLGPGALLCSMSKLDLLWQLRQDIASVPGAQGINNHMGSRFTENRLNLRWVMALMRWRGLYFVDSRTSVDSVAQRVAGEWHVPNLKRDVFLDDDQSEAAIEYQFQRLLALARKRGSALAIGHPHPNTLKVLEQQLPTLQRQGVRLVSLRRLLHQAPPPGSLVTASNKVTPFIAWAEKLPGWAADFIAL